MFLQFQNIFPFFRPSLYHLSSVSSELFIDETEKSWKVYPSCSFNSFVPSKHIRRVIGKRGLNIESSFQKTTYPYPKTHPPKLIWQQTEQLILLLLYTASALWQSMWTTALKHRKRKISEKDKIFEIFITGSSRTQEKKSNKKPKQNKTVALKGKKLKDSEGD